MNTPFVWTGNYNVTIAVKSALEQNSLSNLLVKNRERELNLIPKTARYVDVIEKEEEMNNKGGQNAFLVPAGSIFSFFVLFYDINDIM